MIQQLNKKFFIFLILFLLSIFPFIMQVKEVVSVDLPSNDLYDSQLLKLNSIENLLLYSDSIYNKGIGDLQFDTVKYVDVLSNIIERRFQHGITYYDFSENWIAYVLGKAIWPHFSAIVIPDDILKHEQGLCSQQTMVFMAALKEKGIWSRSVGLGFKEGPGHFLCEVKYGGSWHLYDVSLEPRWDSLVKQNQSLEYYLAHKDSLFLVYQHKIPIQTFNKLTEKISYGEVNGSPAKKMRFFHNVTQGLTYFLPFVLGFVLFMSLWKNRAAVLHDRKNKSNE